MTSTVGATTTLYCYDRNGNMTRRDPSGAAVYNFQYDAESRLTAVSGSATASFVFDGDGNRVKSTAGGVTTVHLGAYFEWTGSTSTMKTYYSAGGARVAVRTGPSTLSFILTDHLGSTSVTTNSSGTLLTDNRYKAWGESRYASGTLPTKFTYTGQYSNVAEFGLMYYGARWYDSSLSRFAQADTLIPQPGDSQAWDRYAYANNNPLAYTDPTGHVAWFVSGAIGAAIGGIVGGALYYANNRDSFDWGECGAAAGAGALAGGLIGSGVGLLAAPATSAALATAATAITGAGTGAAGSAIGYTVTNQESFNTSSFVETTAIGGAVGGISAAIPVSGLGVAAKTATYIVGSETLYALQTDNWTVQGATQAAVYGGFGAAFDVGGSLAVQSFGSQALSNVYSSSGPKGYIPPKGFGDIVRTAARYRSGAALIKTGSGLISGVGSSITSWLLSQRLKAE